ncbi:unnamed protein product [Mytilus edulis]|uniref:Core-binding (CB) domain-containing protein n=1 Tax=Mytilus edulis TaxID=6550 RepID=A0A8S3QH40_MYTED|nr:unnamed protein product [Mytilus edulis]
MTSFKIKVVSQQPAGPAKKSRKGKVPSTRGALSKSQNTTRTVQVSRAATDSNLAIARCAAINIVSDAHQEPPFVPFRIQDEMDTESPNGNEGDALDRPRGDLLPLTPQPGPSGVMSPANNNLGMLLKCSMAPNSWKTYKTAVECLKKFRIIYNNRDIWPVPIDEIAQFIAYLSYKGFSASTVSTYISGLAHTHKINNVTDNTKSFIICKMIEGLRRKNRKNQMFERRYRSTC